MKAEKKFAYLSTASLAKLRTWREENENDPLAEAYYAACEAIGAVDTALISDRLRKSWPYNDDLNNKKWGGWIPVATGLEDLAYQHRDTIGRVILEMIKRERV
jgi:hypothetical protein